MSPSHKLFSRLYGDLAELRDAPYPGVSVFTTDDNIRKLCLVLTPPGGPWKNLSLHFDVEIPENWPTSPPKVKSSVSGIKHPNLFGEYICCDLLKERHEIYDSAGYEGGYTPALTLRGLFLQFLTFFSNTQVEQEGGYMVEIGESYTSRQFLFEEDLSSTRLDDHAGQAALARQWDSDSIVEMELDRSTGMDNAVIIHKVKQLEPSPRRLHLLETESKRRGETRQHLLVSGWKCKTCPYGSDELPYEVDLAYQAPKPQDSSPLLVPPSHCVLENVPDDCLFMIAAHLPSESIITFSKAYPRFRYLSDSSHELLRRELTCFFLRTSLRDCILGVGVSLDPKTRFLTSDFDWLSEEAFTKHQVRESIRKQRFNHFLPLAFNRYHFEKASPLIWHSLQQIDNALRQNEAAIVRRTGRPFPSLKLSAPSQAIRVIYQMMNNVVVALMNSCDDVLSHTTFVHGSPLLRASERAVYAYCHLFHLVICLSRTSPAIFRDAEIKARNFVNDRKHRVKANVPDMGELIVMITVVLALAPSKGMAISWDKISGPCLEEITIRNVRWVLKGSPELEVMEKGCSDYRLAMTFLRCKTSLRLVMFQFAFLKMFVSIYSSNLSSLDNSYGFPDKRVPEKIVEKIKEIYKVNSWPDFFEQAKGRPFEHGKEKFSEMLRQAVETSAQRGYHSPASSSALSQLRKTRERLESGNKTSR